MPLREEIPLERGHQRGVPPINCYFAAIIARLARERLDCNLKKSHQILIIFGTNISDTTGHQMTIKVLTSSDVCFCTN